MIALLSEIAKTLRELLHVANEHKRIENTSDALKRLSQRLTKEEVMQQLKISESTYKRKVKSGELNPMTLSGVDEYFPEDILEAMEESRRRGRV